MAIDFILVLSVLYAIGLVLLFLRVGKLGKFLRSIAEALVFPYTAWAIISLRGSNPGADFSVFSLFGDLFFWLGVLVLLLLGLFRFVTLTYILSRNGENDGNTEYR